MNTAKPRLNSFTLPFMSASRAKGSSSAVLTSA